MEKLLSQVIDFILKHLTIHTLMLNILLTICLYLFTPQFVTVWIQARSGAIPAWLLQLLLALALSFFVSECLMLPAKILKKRKCKHAIDNLRADEWAQLMDMAEWGFQNYPLSYTHPAVQSLQAKSIIYAGEPSLGEYCKFSVNSGYLPFIKQKMLQAKD